MGIDQSFEPAAAAIRVRPSVKPGPSPRLRESQAVPGGLPVSQHKVARQSFGNHVGPCSAASMSSHQARYWEFATESQFTIRLLRVPSMILRGADISVEAVVRRLQPAASATSIRSSSSGFIALCILSHRPEFFCRMNRWRNRPYNRHHIHGNLQNAREKRPLPCGERADPHLSQ